MLFCVVLCAVFRSVVSRYFVLCDDVDCSVSLVHVGLCGSVGCYDCFAIDFLRHSALCRGSTLLL